MKEEKIEEKEIKILPLPSRLYILKLHVYLGKKNLVRLMHILFFFFFSFSKGIPGPSSTEVVDPVDGFSYVTSNSLKLKAIIRQKEESFFFIPRH